MAGGTGKYNVRLIADLAAAATAPAETDGTPRHGHAADEPAPGVLRLPPGRRHCWALGPPDDPGPHPALLTSDWVRQGRDWVVKVSRYSEADDAMVQQWLPSTALRPTEAG